MRQRAAASLFVLGVSVLLAISIAAQDAPTFDPPTLVLAVGTKKVLTLTPAQAREGMTFDFDNAVVSLDAATLTIMGLKAGTTTIIGHQGGKDSNPVTIRVEPVTLKAAALEAPLIQGETRPFQVEIRDASGNAIDLPATVKSADDAIAKVIANASVEATGAGRGDTVTRLNVTANDVALGSIPVTVREAIASITSPPSFDIEEGKQAKVDVRLLGARGSEFTADERDVKATATQPALINATSNILQALVLQSAASASTEVTFFSNEGPGNNQRVEDKTQVTVHPRPGRLTFDGAGTIVPRNGAVRVNPTLRSRDGVEVPIEQVIWRFIDPNDEKYLRLSPSNTSVLVIWNDAGPEAGRPNFVEIEATARTVSGSLISDTFVMRMAGDFVVTDEKPPLIVRLNIMDDQTARDLYGKHAAEEYFVTRVRLNNNLNENKNPALQGASILAFSESIEVKVLYQKRKLNERGKPVGPWQDVSPEDVGSYIPPNYAPPETVQTEPTCKGFFTYRPYMLDMMVNTVDRRDERSPRTRTFRTLAGIGTFASFVTAVAVPGAQSDIPLGIEKFSSLLVPGIEKLWPNLRETHRQNVLSQTMKTIEEIPAGSDLSRVLFFPKKSFRGLVQDHETRVSQICPYRFEIDVAIINKKTAVQAAAQPIR